MTKIALVVGHNSGSRGATRVSDGVSEYEWCGRLAEDIAKTDPQTYRVFRRKPGLSYSREIADVYGQVDASGAKASIELHFNSYNSVSTGTETLTSGSSGSRRLAACLQSNVVQALGLRNRGIVARGRGDRGGLSLHAGRAPAVLLEPYFGSNHSDCVTVDEHYSRLVAAVQRSCESFLRGE